VQNLTTAQPHQFCGYCNIGIVLTHQLPARLGFSHLGLA